MPASSWVLEPVAGGAKSIPLLDGVPVVLGRNPVTGIKKDQMQLSRKQVEVRLDLAAGRASVVQLSETLRPASVNGAVIGAAGNGLNLRCGGTIHLLTQPNQFKYTLRVMKTEPTPTPAPTPDWDAERQRIREEERAQVREEERRRANDQIERREEGLDRQRRQEREEDGVRTMAAKQHIQDRDRERERERNREAKRARELEVELDQECKRERQAARLALSRTAATGVSTSTGDLLGSAFASGLSAAGVLGCNLASGSKRRRLAATPAPVSNLPVIPLGSLVGIGTMPLGVTYPDPTAVPDRADCVQMLHRAIDLGVTLIDTADTYSADHKKPHAVEELIAEALGSYAGEREVSGIIVATKGGMRRIRDDSNGWRSRDMTATATKDMIKKSHAALGGKRPIPLWQIHHVQNTDGWEARFRITMGAVVECVENGLVSRVGLCNASVAHLEVARTFLPIFSVQNKFSVYDKAASKPLPETVLGSCEKGVLEYCLQESIHFFPYGALGGLTTRRGGRKMNAKVVEKAREKNVSPHHLLLAFYRARWQCISHITGFRTLRHMEDAIRASSDPVKLHAAELDEIAAAVKL